MPPTQAITQSTKKTCWLKNLCQTSNTVQSSSTELVKRICAACISNITYLRAIFDDDCYIDQDFGNIKVKMLNENSTEFGVQQHIKWLKGAFEALDKNYLKSIIYTVYTDKSNPNGSIIEMYKLNVTYAEYVLPEAGFSDETCSSGANNTQPASFIIPSLDLEEFKTKQKSNFSDVQKMLVTLGLIVDQLEDFPQQTYFTMKLRYNKRTPKDYSPKGFRKEEGKDVANVGITDCNRICIGLGNTVSNFHSVKLKACYDTRIIGKSLKRKQSTELTNVELEETMNEKLQLELEKSSSLLEKLEENSTLRTSRVSEQDELTQSSMNSINMITIGGYDQNPKQKIKIADETDDDIISQEHTQELTPRSNKSNSSMLGFDNLNITDANKSIEHLCPDPGPSGDLKITPNATFENKNLLNLFDNEKKRSGMLNKVLNDTEASFKANSILKTPKNAVIAQQDERPETTLSGMSDATPRPGSPIMPSNASINTNSTRLSLGLSTSREISPIKTKSRNYDTIYINEESLSKFQPIDIKLLKIYTSDENIVISILQYMILRKFFIPVDMIKRYGIPKTVLNNLVYTFEALEIVDYQKRSYNGVRAINLIPAYKQLKLECHIRKIPENFKLDPMLLDAFDERITEINLDFVEELKRKAKRERLNSRGRGQKLEAFNKSLNLTDTSVNTENRTVGSNNTFDSSGVGLG